MGDTGQEHPSKMPEKPAVPITGGTESGTLQDWRRGLDPSLRAIVDAWPKLPEALRVGIIAMVKAASMQ